MEDTIYYNRELREFHLFVAATFSDLERFKKDKDIASFNDLVLKIVPEVKRYIKKRLKEALVNGQIDKGKYTPDDFVDQLFIEVYENFDDIKDKENLHPWLFRRADELLEDIFIEEEFDSLFFENIDNYSKPEWNAMEENFSTDGDGDLVMLEELDDISYEQDRLVLKHVFIDEKSKNFASHLSNELDAGSISRHAEMVLSKLPSSMQRVFELFSDYQFDLDGIAKIRNRTIEEVETLLEAAQKSLRTSYVNRYRP